MRSSFSLYSNKWYIFTAHQQISESSINLRKQPDIAAQAISTNEIPQLLRAKGVFIDYTKPACR